MLMQFVISDTQLFDSSRIIFTNYITSILHNFVNYVTTAYVIVTPINYVRQFQT